MSFYNPASENLDIKSPQHFLYKLSHFGAMNSIIYNTKLDTFNFTIQLRILHHLNSTYQLSV